MSLTNSRGFRLVFDLEGWLVTPGQCLVCGGRGGYPGPGPATILCPRCKGTGRDPDRGSNWYVDLVLPIQVAAVEVEEKP